MTDINNLEDRITAALDRIRRGIEALNHAGAASPAQTTPRSDLWPVDPEDAAEAPSQLTTPPASPADTAALDAARAEVAELRSKIDEERKATKYLEDRVQVLKARQDEQIAALNARIADMRASFEGFESQIDDLRAANAKVTSHSEKLRLALADDVADASLINMAMQAEIDALRAARDLDAAEIDNVLALLEPLVAEAN